MLRNLARAVRPRYLSLALLSLGILGASMNPGPRLAAAPKDAPARAGRFAPAPQKPIAPAPPKSALLTGEAWQKAPLTPLQPGEVDQLISRELQADKVEP